MGKTRGSIFPCFSPVVGFFTWLTILQLTGIHLTVLALDASEVEEPPASYEPSTPPSVPVEVQLDFLISEVLDVDDKRNEIELEGSLYLTWTDERIVIKENADLDLDPGRVDQPLILDLDWRQKLWLPDLWVESLRHFQIHKSLDDQVTLELFRNKTLVLWQSVSIKTSCPMNFNFYPFDSQVCHLRFSANGLDISRQTFRGGISMLEDVNYSQGATQYSHFQVKQDGNFSFASTIVGREWPQIRASFLLSRRRLDHILQTFQPTGCLVCLSWISFLIPPYIVPGRMVLLVTLLLVVFSTYQSEHQRSPRSSDLKALDIWFVGCLVFLLAAIAEYAVLLFLKRLFIRRKRRQQDRGEDEDKNGKDASTSPSCVPKLGFGSDMPSLTPPGSPPVTSSGGSLSVSTGSTWFSDLSHLPPSANLATTDDDASDGGRCDDVDRGNGNTVSVSVNGRSVVSLPPVETSVAHHSRRRVSGGSAIIPRYRSSARPRTRTVQPIDLRAIGGDRNRNSEMVQDSGSEYGDVNDTEIEGEEFLEKIDENAVKIFPVLFLLFNLVYWCHYLFTSASKKDMG